MCGTCAPQAAPLVPKRCWCSDAAHKKGSEDCFRGPKTRIASGGPHTGPGRHPFALPVRGARSGRREHRRERKRDKPLNFRIDNNALYFARPAPLPCEQNPYIPSTEIYGFHFIEPVCSSPSSSIVSTRSLSFLSGRVCTSNQFVVSNRRAGAVTPQRHCVP